MKAALVISDARQRRDRARAARRGPALEPSAAASIDRARGDRRGPQGRAARRSPPGEAVDQVRQPDRRWRRADIAPGAHVHTHNVASSARPRRSRRAVTAAEPRLAEPPTPRATTQVDAGRTNDHAIDPGSSATAGPTAASARATTCSSCRR